MKNSFLFWVLRFALVATCLPGMAAEPFPLADAIECHPRAGLPNFFEKLSAGGEVKVAYLGGSITEAEGWRPLTFKWFQEKYPQAKLREVNAAISGTGSDFGACRLQDEVLRHNPDLLFVEFAVNDGGRDPEAIIRSMEGIVRQALSHNPRLDICFVYTLSENNLETIQGGKFQRSASAMERVAERYGIPSIHLGLEVAKMAKEGKLVFKGKLPASDAERESLGGKIVFSGDGTHPYSETGHRLYLDAIARSMLAIQAAGQPGTHNLPEPLDPANWGNARLVSLEAVDRAGDWKAVEPASLPGRAGKGRAFWVAGQPADSLSFRFRGTGFGIYGIKGPDAGQFSVTVDDRPAVVATLFDSLCVQDRFRIRPWFYPQKLEDGPHAVKIEIHPELPDKAGILKKPAEGPQFAEKNLYAGAILLVGEIEKP